MISIGQAAKPGISRRTLFAAALAAGLWLAPAFLSGVGAGFADSAQAGGSGNGGGYEGYLKKASKRPKNTQVAGGAGIDGYMGGAGVDGYMRTPKKRSKSATKPAGQNTQVAGGAGVDGYMGGAGVDGYMRTPKKKPKSATMPAGQ